MEEQKRLLERLRTALIADPILAGDVLKLVASVQEEYVNALLARRAEEARNAIGDLIVPLMNRRGFSGMPVETQRNFMRRVIAFQFPNGVFANALPAEKAFFEKYGTPPAKESK